MPPPPDTDICTPVAWYSVLLSWFILTLVVLAGAAIVAAWARYKKLAAAAMAAQAAKRAAAWESMQARARVTMTGAMPVEHWRIEARDLKFGAVIGKGNVGEVYEGTYRGQRVAIKKVCTV